MYSRLALVEEAAHGPGGAVRRLKQGGWLDLPPGPPSAADTVRAKKFSRFCRVAAGRCRRQGDVEGEALARQACTDLESIIPTGS
jgi:hypothetical protein